MDANVAVANLPLLAEADHFCPTEDNYAQSSTQEDRVSAEGEGNAVLFSISSDPALWGNINEQVREAALLRGQSFFHNRSTKYPASARCVDSKTRFLGNDLSHYKLQNGETVSREWIVYSPSTGSISCFACKLYSSSVHAFTNGFSDWKHPSRIMDHESSSEHRRCMITLLKRSEQTGTVDAPLRQQMDAQIQHWKDVLRRVVAVIKFLSERGLPFCGDDELLGSPHNGNYLGILEFISHFDPFLSEHIRSYIWSEGTATICEEFIALIGKKIQQMIASEIQHAKYFSVIVDSTPDLSHVDQLTFIFCFVSEGGKTVEHCIGFEPIHSHTGASLEDCVIDMIQDLGLDLANCRRQSYDNASNMSGKYNGLQVHLKKQNPLIHYIPCAAHSLNLVGVNSIEDSCPDASAFFDLLQSIYAFCASSTHCWNLIFKECRTTLKSLSETRWSCRADSTKVLREHYCEIKEALKKQHIASDTEQKQATRREAAALCRKLEKMETAFMTILWDTVLQRYNATSHKLQQSDLDLATAVKLLESLQSFVGPLCDQFSAFEDAARTLSTTTQSYQHDLTRARKRKSFSDESTENEVLLSGSDKYKVETFNVIIDRLISCLTKRTDAYRDITGLFGILFDMECDAQEVHNRTTTFISTYPEDLNNELADELIQLRHFVSSDDGLTSLILASSCRSC
ncbi:hypothetical protein LDENG_00101180 [Lucifuga dentata]|nr:hypothetical protein LDENG_00101180 [Lucifuga dentata]